MSVSSWKELFLVELPQLPVWLKLSISLVVVITSLSLLTALWRAPSLAREINPAVANRLESGVIAFFSNYDPQFSGSPAALYGEAKGIVRRFGEEQGVFLRVQAEIEERKQRDANWTYANRLSDALALVNALGLTPETKAENAIFLQLPLPAAAQKGT